MTKAILKVSEGVDSEGVRAIQFHSVFPLGRGVRSDTLELENSGEGKRSTNYSFGTAKKQNPGFF